MRVKTILRVAVLGLLLAPLGVAAKGRDGEPPRRHEAPSATVAHRGGSPDGDRAHRGDRRDEDRVRNERDEDRPRRERLRDRDRARRSDHPHGGPPGKWMKRGRGHAKHAGGDADHPHGGPPGHRRHGDGDGQTDRDPTERVLEAVLGD